MNVNPFSTYLDEANQQRAARLLSTLYRLCDEDVPLANTMRPLVVELWRAMPARVRAVAQAQYREARAAASQEPDKHAEPGQEDSLKDRFDRLTDAQQDAVAELVYKFFAELECAAPVDPEQLPADDQDDIDTTFNDLMKGFDL